MSDKAAILRELDATRAAVAMGLQRVSDELNLVKKFERTVRRKPVLWLAGAVGTGFLLAALGGGGRRVELRQGKDSGKEGRGGKLSKGRGKSRHRYGFWAVVVGLLKFLLPLARPLASAYAAKRMADLAVRFGLK